MPVSFIAGNLVINLNIILIITLSLIFFRSDLFKIKYFLIDKIIISYFFLIIVTGIYNDYNLYKVYNEFSSFRGSYATSLKSFLFLRYLLFYLIIRFLIVRNFISFKIFFVSCGLASLFVSFDIIYQLFVGKDIFGYAVNPNLRKLAGPFGDEYIAGGFIQRFSLFAFFIGSIFYLKKFKKINNFLIPLFFFIFLVGIVLSGNRMPLILFLFSLFLLFIFEIKEKKLFISFIVLSLVSILIIFNFNTKVKENFREFHGTILNIIDASSEMKKLDSINSVPKGIPYLTEFYSFYDTWKLNKTIGGGIKNFNFFCHAGPKKRINLECNMHPHNYYLEILTETGLLGFLIVLLIFTISLYLSFYKKYFLNTQQSNNNEITPFIYLFIIEVFPIKSTGSFFTTGNATYFFLILGVLLGLSLREYSIEKKS